jgi:hypothetical protein
MYSELATSMFCYQNHIGLPLTIKLTIRKAKNATFRHFTRTINMNQEISFKIFDNENLKVHEWIIKFTQTDKLSLGSA